MSLPAGAMAHPVSPASRAGEPPVTRAGETLWASYHLYYPGDLNLTLLDFARPLVRHLLSTRRIDSFFFIRYIDQGGPHLRLRLRLLEDVETVEKAVRQSAADFLERWAAPESSGSGRAGALENVPFEPETERYGGDPALGESLDMFALSSAHALRFIESYGDAAPSRRLSLAMSLLLWQAFGFARDQAELLSLLDYFCDWRERMAGVVAAAERAFEARREGFHRLFSSSVEHFLQGQVTPGFSLCTAASLSNASGCLSAAIRDVDPRMRHSIGTSQMHMTSNRLGVTNAEESYVTEILGRTAADLAGMGAEPWAQLSEVLAERANRTSGLRPADLLQEHFSALFPGTT